MPPVIRLEGLAHDYGKTRGVGPLSVEIPPGVHGLVGPNGSGKTTLLKTLLGFLPPTAGRAEVLGLDVARDIRQVRARVGYMAENDVFVPGLNAAQTVRLAAELCGLAPARAHEAASEALHAVGLGEEALHSPNRLSTGQRQRMKLASALVHTPRLLFLDEPTNGLDPRGRRQMLDLVREVARERGISVLLSTHILPDVQAVCDTALVLRDGRLVATDRVSSRVVESQWFDVEVLGDTEAFLAACRRRRLQVRQARAGWQVGCSDAAVLYDVARVADVALLRAVPGRAGIEETILGHLEAKA
jgi:ABC-2 type transport system ATP-binding protein